MNHVVGAQAASQFSLMGMARQGNDGARRRQPLQGGNGQQPNGAAANNQHPGALRRVGADDGVDAATQRLDEDCRLRSQRIGDSMQLTLVCHQYGPPAPARVPAIPRLQPRRDVSLRDALTVGPPSPVAR